MLPVSGDTIAQLSLNHFQSLKEKCGKPDEDRQWTALSSFVQERDGYFKVVALGTGTSCLGFDQLSNTGRLVHDSHAEIIARRSFSRYLLEQIKLMHISNNDSIFELDVVSGKCKVKEGICFHFYSSQSPCGDASIYEIDNVSMKGNRVERRKRKSDNDQETLAVKCFKLDTMEKDNEKDLSDQSDINRTGAKCVPGGQKDRHEPGAGYHEVGLLRTKPGRGVPTHSMSCSDKLMKWNIMGCQGALISLLLDKPIYISTFVVAIDGASVASLERAIIDRIPRHQLEPLLRGTSFELNRPRILGTTLHFRFARSRFPHAIPCGSAISWCDIQTEKYDVIAKNGLRLGVTKKHQDSSKAVSCISRLRLFKSFKKLYENISDKYTVKQSNKQLTEDVSYNDYKSDVEYCQVWNKVQQSLFLHWIKHDRTLDCFSLR